MTGTTGAATQSSKPTRTDQRPRNFTHDMNNCLMSISGFAELILSAGPNDPHLKRYAEKIVRQSQRGFGLVQELKEQGKLSQ